MHSTALKATSLIFFVLFLTGTKSFLPSDDPLPVLSSLSSTLTGLALDYSFTSSLLPSVGSTALSG